MNKHLHKVAGKNPLRPVMQMVKVEPDDRHVACNDFVLAVVPASGVAPGLYTADSYSKRCKDPLYPLQAAEGVYPDYGSILESAQTGEVAFSFVVDAAQLERLAAALNGDAGRRVTLTIRRAEGAIVVRPFGKPGGAIGLIMPLHP